MLYPLLVSPKLPCHYLRPKNVNQHSRNEKGCLKNLKWKSTSARHPESVAVCHPDSYSRQSERREKLELDLSCSCPMSAQDDSSSSLRPPYARYIHFHRA